MHPAVGIFGPVTACDVLGGPDGDGLRFRSLPKRK